MNHSKVLIFIFVLFSITLNAQKVSNVHFEQIDKKIHIYYDLEGTDFYNVNVYCSEDDGKTWNNSLENISGAIENQKPGPNKLIIWDVLKEREQLKGDISFKIEAIFPFPGVSGYFIDNRDGKRYSWVRINNQVWMAENLNFGEKINGNSNMSNNQIIEKYCYNDDENNCEIFGGLYQWSEIIQYSTSETTKDICPDGWHVPDNSEWTTLTNNLGGNKVANKMKSKNEWIESNNETSSLKFMHFSIPIDKKSKKGLEINSSGFSALPGGYRGLNSNYYQEYFSNLGYISIWWTATEDSKTQSFIRALNYDSDKVSRISHNKSNGISVRCVKD
jgi:uncharacterized protein (TIGR02145 family)